MVLGALPAAAARAGDDPALDPENPRNVRFDHGVIEHVSAEPRASVREVGDVAAWAPGTEVSFTAHLRWIGEGVRAGRRAPARWTIDGRAATGDERWDPATLRWLETVRWSAAPGRREVAVSLGRGDSHRFETDALRVLLLVERRTFEEGERRFGSFVRRFRKSLDDLHALFAASVHPLAPDGVLDRFRIDRVVVYDRPIDGPVDRPVDPKADPRPAGWSDHPEFDVAIACDEGGPLAGFSIPEYSIGHNFTGPAAHHGLWSSWGEQALWHELMHFRGVQDFYIYEVPDGALPGRWKGRLPLPGRYAVDLLASPYQRPVLTEYAAVMANLRRGVARVGACEDTENRYGHMWNGLPARLDLAITRGGAPANGARVRWWRSRPAGRDDGRLQGVPSGIPPDGEATADAKGAIAISGDTLGRASAREERSLWVLVEVEAGGETRFEVLYGLDLNLAYARGAKDATTVVWAFEDLLVPNGKVREGR